MKYKFYSKNSKKKEAIGKVEARSYKEAIEFFSQKKRLTTEEFQKLYEDLFEAEYNRLRFIEKLKISSLLNQIFLKSHPLLNILIFRKK